MRSVATDIQAIGRIKSVPTILEVAARTTGMRFTAVARVTDTTWTCCAVYDLIDFGLKPGGELKLETTICNEIRQHHQPVVFGHASVNPQFADHPTPKMYGFESYISIPIIRTNGEFFGTLCALDPLPVALDDPNILKTMELFAQLIASNLDTDDRLEQSNAALIAAHERAKLREQFIAVLGHDLRNPLAAVSVAAEILQEELSDPRDLKKVSVIRGSCRRMDELIENILDFAQGKLGGGIQVSLEQEQDLAVELKQVSSEIQIAHPDHSIDVAIALASPVVCDPRRVGQLLGNLLGNAMLHGDADVPVRVMAQSDDTSFVLSVTNSGPCIPEPIMEQLFEPFTREASNAPRSGLGLGLYIAAEIAKAHGGTLQVSSSEEGLTCFTFHMPHAKPTGRVIEIAPTKSTSNINRSVETMVGPAA